MHSIDTASQRPVALGAPNTAHLAADHSYRADIDGLRGVAIIAVVLFHAGVPGFGGGFVGVDVFFVISGFLITSIIARENSKGAFSLVHFYERRVRRIFPALITMLALCIGPAYVLLPPSELKLFAQSLLSAALFGSNFFFWSKTGYFDAPAETHPLLHTWSLAIEEQFYLVFPLLFMLAAKALGAKLNQLFAGIAAASLCAGWWLLSRNPDAAFFFSPVRAWELLIGSMIALRACPSFRSRWQRQGAMFTGFVLILASVFFATAAGFSGLPFPGLATLLPCIGTALIIHAGIGEQSTAATLLGSAIPVAIGRISYSWYLWHWPILVFAKLHLERPLSGTETAIVLAVTIIAAVVSYYAVEQPYRRPNGVFQRSGLFISAGAAMAGLVALSAATVIQDGFPKRFQRLLDLANPENKNKLCLLNNTQSLRDWGERRCLVNEVAGPIALLWGDSFGGHYLPAFLARGEDLGYNVLQYNLEGCPPLLNDEMAPTNRCNIFNLGAGEIIGRYGIKSVILVARWQSHFTEGGKWAFDDIAPTVKWLQARGIRVAVIGQSPTFQASVPRSYWWRLKNGKLVNPDAKADPGTAFNARLRLATAGAVFLEPSPALCPGPDSCTIGEGLKPYYWDTGHFTTTGSIRAMAPLWQPLDQLMRAPP